MRSSRGWIPAVRRWARAACARFCGGTSIPNGARTERRQGEVQPRLRSLPTSRQPPRGTSGASSTSRMGFRTKKGPGRWMFDGGGPIRVTHLHSEEVFYGYRQRGEDVRFEFGVSDDAIETTEQREFIHMEACWDLNASGRASVLAHRRRRSFGTLHCRHRVLGRCLNAQPTHPRANLPATHRHRKRRRGALCRVPGAQYPV